MHNVHRIKQRLCSRLYMNVNDEITVALLRINLSILIETKYCVQRKLTRIQHEWNTNLTLVHFYHDFIAGQLHDDTFKGSSDSTHFILSMSERVGSDIERLWLWSSISTQSLLKSTSFNFRLVLYGIRVVLCRIRLFPTLIWKIKWLLSELPLN